MKHSVIIPTFHQPELTAVHVRECMNSTRIPDEIIVVNDHGDLSVKDRIKALDLKTKVVYAYIRENIDWGYNMACNLGFWLSRGDYVSIEDSDHIPWRDAYKEGVRVMDEYSDVNRVCYTRQWVGLEEVLSKPFEEWQPLYEGKKLGPNQMVSMLRRELYLTTKGQDERFCGRYGFMAYDWAAKYRRLNTKIMKLDGYYIIKDGSEPNVVRGMSSINKQFYKENVKSDHHHSKHGILNCTFDFEIL